MFLKKIQQSHSNGGQGFQRMVKKYIYLICLHVQQLIKENDLQNTKYHQAL